MPRRSIFWNGLESNIPSRKPAIKSPKRHQWHYCNPAYDPMEPLPEQYLPPYASDRAHSKNYRSIFYSNMPKHHRNRYRRMWAKNMTIADQRWRQAWERKLAERRKAIAKVERIADRIKRQRSWEAWQANKAAAAAPAKPQRQQQQQSKKMRQQQLGEGKQVPLAAMQLEAGSGEQARAAVAAAPEVK
ncbi:hypothetical protein OEZ85_011238 [Tetradesmus obliquus]|uniref:Nuclease associated modular domain-containing protein n=1 Tax=Tetradesmus obliquus TaxID=3088 RepID=A0ABY8TRS5_TETOB|nr:hypothetical protein OEZ85_011238 [Tetradesmus obliquus]